MGAPFNLTTDRDHRVQVQFSWQRTGATQANGPQKDGAPMGAPMGVWVRVAEA